MSTKKLLLSDIVASDKLKQVPSNYIFPITKRPNLQEVVHDSIPLIDLHDLEGTNRSQVLDEIRQAGREYGFFQVKNHGVLESTIANMKHVVKEFFDLPEEERLKMYSDDPKKVNRLATSFNIHTEKVNNWRDYLGLHCYPLEDYMNQWPANPVSFRDHTAEYCRSIRGLALKLIEAISESLGVGRDYLIKQLGQQAQLMAINNYPPCPQPDLTYGLKEHTDNYLITILLLDEVPGLQVLKNDNWVAVEPIPNTFVINLGDQMQVISNNKYKSAFHRVVVNSEKERKSIASFYVPSPEAVIGPAPQLVTDDEPAVYRQFTYAEYNQAGWDNPLANCLDMFKVT